MRCATILLLAFFTVPMLGMAQKKKHVIQQEPRFYRDSVPDITVQRENEEEEEEDFPEKEKKPKKNVYYGMKCKKAFTKKGAGKRLELEMFHYLKKPAAPDKYVPFIYVWDLKKNKVIQISKKDQYDPLLHKILHGPYKRTVAGSVVEEGVFYIGCKHGRWEGYTEDKVEEFNDEKVEQNTLLVKEKYYKGWPKEAEILYYDAARTKVKEVFPYENGKLHGNYFQFLENGQIFMRGQYENGKKVGLWLEYFPDRERRRKEIQYPATGYDTGEPYVLNEWDERNQMIVVNGEKVEPGSNIETDPIKRALKKRR